MKSHEKRIQYLLESIEALQQTDYRKRKLLLTLLYWKVFDGIPIPDEVMRTILSQGTNPETISRALRRAQSETKNSQKNEGGRV